MFIVIGQEGAVIARETCLSIFKEAKGKAGMDLLGLGV